MARWARGRCTSTNSGTAPSDRWGRRPTSPDEVRSRFDLPPTTKRALTGPSSTVSAALLVPAGKLLGYLSSLRLGPDTLTAAGARFANFVPRHRAPTPESQLKTGSVRLPGSV